MPKQPKALHLPAAYLSTSYCLFMAHRVMMGVMEEKTNRIAEVIVSSVKPFQMMLGKILGIGMVALTQFFLWIAFVFIVYNIGKASGSGGMANAMVGNMQAMFSSVNVPLILFCFGFYFGRFLFLRIFIWCHWKCC